MVPISSIFGRLGNSMFQGAYIIAQAKAGYIDDIYAQNPMYFEEYEDDIKALYRQGVGEPIDMVAIHVRRGDYVGHSFYVDLMETPYYEDAMALFPREKFLVFSDDIEWCKKQEIFRRCEFSEGNDELTDMNLMAACKAVITANSSFSWWSGYLSTGQVIAPSVEHWYSDGIERTYCPVAWTRL